MAPPGREPVPTRAMAFTYDRKTFDAVSFSGCGTLNFFQTGVAASLQRAQMVDGLHFAGASAGGGLAALVAGGVDAQHICETAIELLEPHANTNILRRPDVLLDFADRFLDALVEDDILDRIGDRVHISITTVPPLRNRRVNRFRDVDDLCRAIRASCHIPSLRYRSVRFRGDRCIDGGFTGNTPLVGDRCLTVSPFGLSRHVDLGPSRMLNPFRAIVIPDRRRARAMFERGVADGDRYLDRLHRGAVALKPKRRTRHLASRLDAPVCT